MSVGSCGGLWDFSLYWNMSNGLGYPICHHYFLVGLNFWWHLVWKYWQILGETKYNLCLFRSNSCTRSKLFIVNEFQMQHPWWIYIELHYFNGSKSVEAQWKWNCETNSLGQWDHLTKTYKNRCIQLELIWAKIVAGVNRYLRTYQHGREQVNRQIPRPISRTSFIPKHLVQYLDTWDNIWTVGPIPRHLSSCPDTFPIIWTLELISQHTNQYLNI